MSGSKPCGRACLAAVKTGALIVSLTGAAPAQSLWVGGVVGTNLSPSFQTVVTTPGLIFTNARTLSGGGSLEWNISRPVSLEVDGLYRRLRAAGKPASSSFSVVTWEFPALAHYRFALRHVRPFLEVGPSFRAAGNLNEIHPSHYGFTAGAGIETRVGRLLVEPAVRYTRWAQDVHVFRADVRTRPDQLELLVGFRTPPPSGTSTFGRHFSIGFVAGSNLTSDFGSVTSTQFPPALANIGYRTQLANATFVSSAGPRSFDGGPLAALELSRGFSLEVEALYRPLRSSVRVFLPGARKDLKVSDHRISWEFPVLAQHSWHIGGVNPYLEVGPSFRLLQDVYGAAPYGIAAGAGVQKRLGRMKIAPGIRLTHWTQQGSRAPTDPRRNEVAILAGFSL